MLKLRHSAAGWQFVHRTYERAKRRADANWLFADTVAGANVSANLYWLLHT